MQSFFNNPEHNCDNAPFQKAIQFDGVKTNKVIRSAHPQKTLNLKIIIHPMFITISGLLSDRRI